MSTGFHEKSYRKHSGHYDDHAQGGPRSEDARKWFLEDTVDSWRHMRMHRLLDPLLEANKNALWLTVGDGRYGKEAHYILEHRARAMATDISDTLLKEAARAEYISDYSRQNAEALTYEDREFDFVLCKESLHHFPRPFRALYEMIRVSKKGVVLIEPTDLKIGATLRWKIFMAFVESARKLTGRSGGHQLFEEVGNYVYGISRLEMEKVGLGLNMPMIAIRGINDYYMKGVEDEKADKSSRMFKRIKRRIAMNDIFCRLGLKPHSTTCVILFHNPIDPDLRRRLSGAGFEVVDLPENPYIERNGDK